MFYYFYDFDICKMTLAEREGKLIKAKFNKSEEGEMKETPLLKNAALQLKEYFNGKRKSFDLPILLQGTLFRLKVYEELLKIPYGKTLSYKQIAKNLNKENAARAVGGAVHNNPIAIIVPCHRVIGSDNSLTGFAGGLNLKRKLLEIEEIYIKN